MQFIDLSKYDGRVLPALRDHFKKIVIPQIRQYDQWGPLKENKQGQRQIEAFRRTLSDFESYLNSAQINIDGAVKLKVLKFDGVSNNHHIWEMFFFIYNNTFTYIGVLFTASTGEKDLSWEIQND